MVIKCMKNKKGIYFTMVTIVFLTIFLFYFVMHSYTKLSDRMLTIEMRVDSMNNFIKSLNRDIERGLYISSFRAILSLEQYAISHGEFFDDIELRFMEVFVNSTINGENVSLMQGSSFSDWVEGIKKEGRNLNIDADIDVKNFSIFQKDPWYVTIGVNYTLRINDTTGIAYWIREEYVETNIDINGFEDPLYIVYGLGWITNIINKTLYDGNYTFKVNESWNISNLLAHMEDSLYTSNSDAPSFLMRFENDLGNSPYGIECLVDLKKLSDHGLEVDTTSSVVDHHYWAGDGNGDYTVNDTPSWFKIDGGHLARYNLSLIAN